MHQFATGLEQAQDIVDVNISAGSLRERISGLGFWRPLYYTAAIAVTIIVVSLVAFQAGAKRELNQNEAISRQLVRMETEAQVQRATVARLVTQAAAERAEIVALLKELRKKR